MVALRRIEWIGVLVLFWTTAFSGILNGEAIDWETLESVLVMPDDLDVESALGKQLDSLISALDREALDRESLRTIAETYHANGYDYNAKVLYDHLIASCRNDVECARLNYLAAQLVKEKGDSEGATSYLEASVAAFDGYGLALAQLGDAKFKVGEQSAAEELFERAKAVDSELATAYIGLARIYEQRGLKDKMVTELESILQFDEGNSSALALLSQLYARLGQEKKAYEVSESIGASSSAPENDPWFEEVREAIYDVQRLDFLFLDYFVLDRFGEAMPYLKRMEALDPGNPRYNRYRAVMYIGSGYYKRAEEQLHEGLAKGGEADVFYPLLVKSISLRGNKEEAEMTARKAVERFGASGELNLEWARLLIERQAAEEAMAALDQGLESDPYLLELHFTRARLGMRMGMTDAANESLQMVRQLAPMDAKALVRAALVLMEAGRFAEALPLLNQSYRAAPYDNEVIELLSDAHFELGQDARKEGHAEEALSCFEKSLELLPKRADALGARAQLAVESGRLDMAESALRSFLEVAGGRPEILLIFGDVLFRNGNIREARENWKMALQRANSGAGSLELKQQLKARLQQSESMTGD